MMSEYREIELEIDAGIAVIRLNRPEKMNAFTVEMMAEMIDAFDRTDADDKVRSVIVTGAGDRAFCAGADLTREDGSGAFSNDIDVTDLSDERVRDGGGRLTLRMFRSEKPIIGAINGVSVGIGATMQLPMDFRLASLNVRYGFVFARRGIAPEACSSWFLPRIVGTPRAIDWCMTGRLFDAAEALSSGLVRSLHEPDELMDAAVAIANEIASNTSAVSVSMTRAMLWRLAAKEDPMFAHQIESRTIYSLSRSRDAKEGVESFLQKRLPQYSDKVSENMPGFYPWWDDVRWQ